MEYRSTITLKDGRSCVIRNGTEQDGQTLLDIYVLTHSQTDYLLSYPDEADMTAEQEAAFLKAKTESVDEIELLAEVGGIVVGSTGIGRVGKKEKVRRRAEFGISVDKSYWGLGIGRALTKACVECAREAGYQQLELDVVADNTSAISLYKSVGFIVYGRNPTGFRSRYNGWQELVLMRLELEGEPNGQRNDC